MAGSRKSLIYTTDAGDDFALQADESNTEAAGVGVDMPNGTSALYSLPKCVKPRYGRYSSADGLVVRKAYACTPDATYTTPIIDAVSGLSLELRQIVAEERTFFTGTDTGLLDGDAT